MSSRERKQQGSSKLDISKIMDCSCPRVSPTCLSWGQHVRLDIYCTGNTTEYREYNLELISVRAWNSAETTSEPVKPATLVNWFIIRCWKRFNITTHYHLNSHVLERLWPVSEEEGLMKSPGQLAEDGGGGRKRGQLREVNRVGATCTRSLLTVTSLD